MVDGRFRAATMMLLLFKKYSPRCGMVDGRFRATTMKCLDLKHHTSHWMGVFSSLDDVMIDDECSLLENHS
jgi:hypothetical protein